VADRLPNPTRRLAIAAAAATGMQVGAAMVATRFVVAAMGPATLALLRYAIGFLCLLPVLMAGPRVRFARRDLLPIALLGIGQFGILIALLNVGLRFIPSGRAALIFSTFPLMTMLIAAALGQERLTAAKTFGVLLTIVGVGLALGERAVVAGGGSWIGEAAVGASALTGAVCSVLYRPYLRRYSPLAVSTLAMLASVVFLVALAGGTEALFAAPPRLSGAGWLAVLFIGVGSGAGYFLWLWALRHAPATEVTVFLALSPLTAMGLGAVWLGEGVSVGAVVGLGAVAVGLWLATRSSTAAADARGR
jgi:drug/metabolite transporter (DMT)-like permease